MTLALHHWQDRAQCLPSSHVIALEQFVTTLGVAEFPNVIKYIVKNSNILSFRYSEISLLVEFWKEHESIWKAAPLLPTYIGHSTHLCVADAVPQCSPGLSPQPPPSGPKPIRPKSTPVPTCPHEPPPHDSQGLGSPTSITKPNTLASRPHLE